MRKIVAAIIAAMAVAGPVSAQQTGSPAAPQADVISSKWAKESACGPGNAQPVDFGTLLQALQQWHNKCVAVSGYFQGRALFLNADDTTRRLPPGDARRSLARVGIYSSPETAEKLHKLQDAEYVTVIGYLWDCQDMQGPGVIMVLGYCHMDSGAILGISSFKITREPLKNQED